MDLTLHNYFRNMWSNSPVFLIGWTRKVLLNPVPLDRQNWREIPASLLPVMAAHLIIGGSLCEHHYFLQTVAAYDATTSGAYAAGVAVSALHHNLHA